MVLDTATKVLSHLPCTMNTVDTYFNAMLNSSTLSTYVYSDFQVFSQLSCRIILELSGTINYYYQTHITHYNIPGDLSKKWLAIGSSAIDLISSLINMLLHVRNCVLAPNCNVIATLMFYKSLRHNVATSNFPFLN